MLLKKETTIDDRTITCNEISVAKVDEILNGVAENGPLDKYFGICGYDVTPDFVSKCTGLSIDELGNLSATEIGDIVDDVCEVNKSFLSRIKIIK